MRANTLESLMDRMIPVTESGCYLWLGATADEYGIVSWGSRRQKVHRVVWTLANGPIPDGIKICHHCDTPSCGRLAHLFPGTQFENIMDAVHKGRHGCMTHTHCQKGHEYSAANTGYRTPKSGPQTGRKYRFCITCRCEQDRISKRLQRLRKK